MALDGHHCWCELKGLRRELARVRQVHIEQPSIRGSHQISLLLNHLVYICIIHSSACLSQEDTRLEFSTVSRTIF
jgi:hypothetical protein